MIEGSCHCGAVRIEIPTAPDSVTSCNCSICRRTGTLMAYYRPADVAVHGRTDTYQWGDKFMDIHRCRVCGCLTHWSPVDPASNRMGVNVRMMAPEILAAARVRRFDGADSWTFLDP